MSSPELADLEEIRALIASGRHIGVLTHSAVATAVAELDFDETDIEELHSLLERCEIELVDDVAPQPAAPPPDQAQVGKPTPPGATRDDVEDWRDNFDDYITPAEDFEGYENQPVESDARDAGDDFVDGLTGEDLERLREGG